MDRTGVGRPVLDLLRTAKVKARLVPVTVTAGRLATCDDGRQWHVPKADLVDALRLLLEDRRIAVAKSLAEVDALAKELERFRVMVTAAARETFGSATEGDHDDLVTAVALAAWWCDRRPVIGDSPYGVGRSIIDTAPPGVFIR